MGTRRAKPSAAAGRAFFKRLISEGPWTPVYLVHGEERFLVDEAVRRLVTSVFPDGRDDFNFTSYHGSEVKGAEIASAAAQVPMLAARRVVVVRGVDKLSPSELDAVAAYAEHAYDTCLLVLEALKVDRRKKQVKRLLASELVTEIEFGTLWDNEAAPWVGRRARAYSIQLEPGVAEYLVEALGTALGPLDKALERLSIYLGDSQRASIEDAQAVVPDTRARSVFELTDHLAARRFADAVGCFHRMMEQGESPIGALAMIARQFRQLVAARDAMSRGIRGRDLARVVGCPPSRAGDYERAAQRFTDQRLEELLRAITETDLRLKSSRLRRELLVERLFVKICDGAR